MRTLKFGGTSLGDAGRIAAAAAIVRSRLPHGPVVVASAMAGVTDALLQAADLAAAGRGVEAATLLDALEARHLEACAALRVGDTAVSGLASGSADAFLRACFAETRDRLTGVALLGELTLRSRDAISATGELASSALLAACLGGAASWVDARDVVRTDDRYGQARPCEPVLAHQAAQRFPPLVGPGRCAVTQGFIGSDGAGVTTTLGRGGSDYSASLLGAALDADAIEIWTDVDGVLSADPRLVPSATVLTEVLFEEAAELAAFGARVLHPRTIRPALRKGIPVRVLNTFRPQAPGTLVRASRASDRRGVRAITHHGGVTVFRLGNPRLRERDGFGARVFAAFDRHHVPVGLVATSDTQLSLTTDACSGLPALAADLGAFTDVELLPNQAVVATVGTALRRAPGVAGRIFGALHDVDVTLISMGASDHSIAFVVDQAQAPDVVRRLHAELLEPPGARAA